MLRLIQNNDMVPLDLLVRESVQNSLDASLDKQKPVKVCFTVRDHNADAIAKLLPDIGNKLKQYYQGNQKLLEIRDTGTQGLAGPISGALPVQDGQPNHFNNLVYNIGRPQQRNDAGGAWGLGKTVYYRMGAGIVFYYSRIKDGNGYEERLAVCLVENETLQERMMSASKTGIAWWGGKNIGTWPSAFTDAQEIRSVIDSLGSRPFADNETGTAVIIPFLRSDLLPQDPIGGDEEECDGMALAQGNAWYGGIEGYIAFSLLKWYAVRIANSLYPSYSGKSRLDAYVNGLDINTPSPPLYKVIRTLYNRHHFSSDPFDVIPVPPPQEVLVERIILNRTFVEGPCAGWVVAVRLTRKQLGMEAPDNQKSPFTLLLNLPDDSSGRSVVGYHRSPGMIVRWNDERWKNNLRVGEGESYVIALFVPNSTAVFLPGVAERINPDLALQESCTLEHYLRSIEMADHSSWGDRQPLTIVSRIRERVQDAVNTKFFPVREEAREVSSDLGLSRQLADVFLPKRFGRDARHFADPPGPGNNGNAPQGSTGKFSPYGLRYMPGEISMNWSLEWGRRGFKSHVLNLRLASESGSIKPEEWVKDSKSLEFPFAFGDLSISSVVMNKKANQAPIILELKLPAGNNGPVAAGDIQVRRKGTGIEIINMSKSKIDSSVLEGTLTVKINKGPEGWRPVISNLGLLEDKGGDIWQ